MSEPVAKIELELTASMIWELICELNAVSIDLLTEIGQCQARGEEFFNNEAMIKMPGTIDKSVLILTILARGLAKSEAPPESPEQPENPQLPPDDGLVGENRARSLI